MSYTKTKWTPEQTELSAANFNKIEDELELLDNEMPTSDEVSAWNDNLDDAKAQMRLDADGLFYVYYEEV